MLYLEFQVLPDWRLPKFKGSACCKVVKDMRAESNSHLIMEPSFDVEQYINCISIKMLVASTLKYHSETPEIPNKVHHSNVLAADKQ